MFSFVKKVFLGAVMLLVLHMGVGVPVVKAVESSTSSYEGIASQGIIFAGICPSSGECKCRDTGDCDLNDVLQLFVNAANFILGITGSAVLFVFIYGGFKWLLSRGDSHWVEAGKKAMTAGVIGLCIVFGSYAALNFIVSGLTVSDNSTPTSTNLENTVQNSITNNGGSVKSEDLFSTQK